MATATFPLELITVPIPCTVSWAGMAGDERRRFCGSCRQSVFNLSEMTREAAEELIQKHEGKLCVRFYRRPDGTVLTSECNGGVRKLFQRFMLAAKISIGLLAMLIGWIAWQIGVKAVNGNGPLDFREIEPFQTIIDWVWPLQAGGGTMGKMCVTKPTTPTAPNSKPEVAPMPREVK